VSFAVRTQASPVAGGGGGGGFTPVTHNVTAQGVTVETVPLGATLCTVTDQAPGGGGTYSGGLEPTAVGGSAGGMARRTIAVVGGNTFTVNMGAPGFSGANAGNATVAGTVAGGAINLVANGGITPGFTGWPSGGTASGGTTNISGGPGSSSGGGASPFGPGFGNGADGTVVSTTGDPGIVQFAYT